VLEHVPDPESVLRELFRALKPCGHLWMTVPFFFAEHMEPYDYYRYTQYGLLHLLNRAGFKVERLERLEGYYMTLAYQLATAAKSLPITKSDYGNSVFGALMFVLAIPLKIQFLLLSLFFSRLEISHKNVKVGYSKNYAVIAVKP
jgi:SAM-dependent methyltransferase